MFVGTGINGLDILLCGGLFAPTRDAFPSVVISGPPGAGKSVLALTMAVANVKAESSVLFVLTEERPDDFFNLASNLKLFAGSAAVVLDNSYGDRSTHGEPNSSDDHTADYRDYGTQLGKLVFSFFPLSAIEGGPPHEAQQYSLLQHIQLKLRSLQPKCRLVIIDSLWAMGRGDALPESSRRNHRNPLAHNRTMFKELCELSSEHQLPVVIILEHEGHMHEDWREFVADIILKIHRVPTTKRRSKRVIEVAKSRYQCNLDGTHSLEITPSGATISPNGYSLLDYYRTRREPSEILEKPIDPKRKRQEFGKGGAFSKFLKDGIATGSATLIYGDDQTRKRLTAVRFLEQTFCEQKDGNALVICFGPDQRAYKRVLDKYSSGHPELSERVAIYDGPNDEDDTSNLIGELAQQFELGGYWRVVVDDIAAMQQWSSTVPALKDLFGSYDVTSLFVHTLEHEEQHRHRVMFDTIIRTKRFTLLDKKLEQFFAYHKTKENSISPTDQDWWRVTVKDNEISLTALNRFLVKGELRSSGR